jgi:hypothetical protein
VQLFKTARVGQRRVIMVKRSSPFPGPDLPLELEHHCLVTLNDTTVLLIGGEPADLSHSKATFYCNTEHQT